MRAGGPGGQKVNKTESAIRLTHLETGISVHMQDEKSQHKNRARARTILAARLFDHFQGQLDAKRAAERRGMIGNADRSAKIRAHDSRDVIPACAARYSRASRGHSRCSWR